MKIKSLGAFVASIWVPLAVLATILWGATVWFVFVDPLGGHLHLMAMHLNELGDFLAGTMAPVAFIWFALSYFAQNKMVRQHEVTSQQSIFFQLAALRIDVLISIVTKMVWLISRPETFTETVNTFAAGDRFVFVQRARDWIIGKFPDIKSMIVGREEKFYAVIDSYLNEFEGLMSAARHCDADGTIRKSYLYSPFGKLYEELCGIRRRSTANFGVKT